MPEEFRGLQEKERRVIDVEKPDVELVKKVIEGVAEQNRVKPSEGEVSATSSL